MEKQGSFKLLRSFLGSIAGGLSSLATLPFAKRKTPEAPLLLQPPPPPSPPPFTGIGGDGNNLSKLYPDMELSESRKRARLSVNELLKEKGDCSNEKQKNVIDWGEPFGEGSGETSYVHVTQVLSHDVGANRDEFDLSMFGSGGLQGGITSLHTHDQSDNVTHGVSHVGNTALNTPYHFDVVLHVGDSISDKKVVSEHEEMLHDLRDDFDDNLASFRRSLEARKTKQKKRGQEPMKEEELPTKRVRFGNTDLGLSSDAQSSLTSSAHGTGMPLKKHSSSTKRKRADEAEEKNEKKLRALTLSEEPVHIDGKPSTVGMGGVSTRKRERVDDENAHIKSVEKDLELRKAVLVQNLPLNASRKAISKEFSQFGAVESMQLSSAFFKNEKSRRKLTSIGASSKTPNSQNAHIVFKDELSAMAALAYNMKEFNGNILHVTADCADGTSKEAASAALDNTWSVFIRNIPIDVKDEELFQLFAGRGSLKLDVEAIRVTRHLNTGLGNATAHVFLKTEADMNQLLASQQTLKLRERVLSVSRTSGSTRIQQRLTQPRLTKRSITSEAQDSASREKRVKLSLPHEAITISKTVELQERHTTYTRSKQSNEESLTEHTGVTVPVISKTLEHQERRTAYTRSKQSSLESLTEHTGVSGAVPHVYTTRHVAASTEQSKNVEESSEAKRKRVENRQRGISRSKKIRRT